MSVADEQPFLDAILARYADDGPRLVYADWLDENGDPARAELVRVQIALARLSAEDPRRPELADRQTELLQRYRRKWTAHLADLGAEFAFRRGIPDAASIDAAAFLGHGADLLRRVPVRRVRFLDAARVMPALVQSPLLASVAELDLYGNELGNAGVQLLARSPHLGRVRLLELGFNGIDDAGVAALAASSALPGLQVLALNDNGPVTADGVRVLAASPFFAGLRSLDLSGNDIGETGVRAVFTGTTLAGLERLDLSGNDLADAGAAAIAPAANLRTLRFAHNQMADAGAAALAAVAFAALRRLDVSGNRMTPRGIGLLEAAAKARGYSLDAGANVAGGPTPVAVGDVLPGVLAGLIETDEVARLRRGVNFPARRKK